MRHRTVTVVLLGTVLSVGAAPAFAGPGANVYACVDLPVAPQEPLKVKFKAGGAGDICMNDEGHDADLTVSTAGISCVSVGYVEGNSGPGCWTTPDSIWNLSFTAPGTSYNGSTKSSWWYRMGMGDNRVRIMGNNQDATGTTICASKAWCTAPTEETNPLKWTKQGPLYFIFKVGS